MNDTTIAFLINDDLRAVIGIYKPDLPGQKNEPRVMFKTLDKSIKVDDVVMVPSSTRHRFTTFKITEVDVDVDFDCPTKIDWIVGKLDTVLYDKYKALESAALVRVKSAEKAKKKRELKETLLSDPALKDLALTVDTTPAIASTT